MRRPVLFLTALAFVAGGLVLFVSPARSDTHSDKALADAVARGKALYSAPFVAGGKSCASCHGAGPNKMTAARAKSFPRWDKTAQKVIGIQQKINQMIAAKSGGKVFTADTAAELSELLTQRAATRSYSTETKLWQAWPTLLALLGLLTLEWVGRKWAGLP